ncbi:MAG: hypothetical protein IPF88_03610 [Candidatus Microthrix sp.]|nr:hypothetical protein [Candidatus Microthrix sp.]MBK6437697.1 hypothetical protein [Candidatus Microthrix sp.]
MTSLTQVITRDLIGRRAGELLMLHAGAVCNTTTGATVAMPMPLPGARGRPP